MNATMTSTELLTRPPSDDRKSAHRRRRGLLGRLVIATTALAVGLVVMGPRAQQADAWYYAANIGRAGSVSIPQVQGFDYSNRVGTYPNAASPVSPLLTSNGVGPVVYRSPASSGAQLVAGNYTIQWWTGSGWANIGTQSTGLYSIPAGHSWVRLPALNRQLLPQYKGYVRVSWKFAWMAENGASLGGTAIEPNTTSDFRCVTTQRPCASSSGWIRLGRHYTLGGGW